VVALTHSPDHDPIRDHNGCGVCDTALRMAFNRLANLSLGPADADELIRRLTELTDEREEAHALSRHYDREDF
jgi:hypothetical protein